MTSRHEQVVRYPASIIAYYGNIIITIPCYTSIKHIFVVKKNLISNFIFAAAAFAVTNFVQEVIEKQS